MNDDALISHLRPLADLADNNVKIVLLTLIGAIRTGTTYEFAGMCHQFGDMLLEKAAAENKIGGPAVA